MRNKNVFGDGFLEPDPSAYGATKSVLRPARNLPALRRAIAVAGIWTVMLSGVAAGGVFDPPVANTPSSSSIIIPIRAPGVDIGSWNGYLDMLKTSGQFAEEHVKFVERFFLLTREMIDPSFPFPHTGPTPDGAFQLVWDEGRHHVDVDIFSSGVFEWFYSNRDDHTSDGQEDCPAGQLPLELAKYLLLIAQDAGGRVATAPA